MTLTLQLFHHDKWQDAALLDIADPAAGRYGLAQLSYHPQRYALEYLGRDDGCACSLSLPVDLMQIYRSKPWFAFLDDIMPAGASRRYWVNYLDIGHLSPAQQDYQLLARGTIAPVGNLRIKEALPVKVDGSQLTQMRFQLRDVVERHSDFLEYAQAMGAASGGATGAGGEAPKLLVRCSARDEIWIDTYQDDLANSDQHYLVKFPRGNRTQDDCDILRAEFHYYQELNALGIETINTQHMRLLEGERYPSLWLPRFDVDFISGQQQRYGLESLYAVLGKAPSAYLNHFTALRDTLRVLRAQYRVTELGEPFDQQAFVVEWVKRDFLNVVFGNSDNHGRNTSLIKRPQGITLAPVYDFAPMKADPEGITRSTTWGSPYEEGGRFDWIKIAHALADVAPPEAIIEELMALAKKLKGLPERLAERGVSTRLLQLPAIGFDFLDEKLKAWELLN
ncbi:type II toxin-antitoxin system HipA family toxin [Cellvibrio sp. OA-2007]|uniref:type II toxin-antitoxin system HipA family toxin n=1 Tax=Cellvibrio sp. OA-2007 TaxID=529823 RepID=UPI0007822F37|nr:HipA domain-containing protein [Cellvibrio sp. OA-2007]